MRLHWTSTLCLSLWIMVTVANCAGPYKGRIIEAEGGAPIPGVVVVGYWTNEIPTVGGGSTRCLDARETVSDEKGEFTIPTSTYGEILGEMVVAIYKVGYAAVRCYWDSFNHAGGCLRKEAERDGDRVIVPLEKVPKCELGTAKGEPPSVCGRKDGKSLSAFQNERKEFRRALGLKE